MMTEPELSDKISALENRKSELINHIKRLNKKIRYKKYEEKALEPFLEKTKDINVFPLRKQKNMLEFKIATQAYTPKIERDLLKGMKKIDEELEKVKEVERARRKKKFIEGDIKEAETDVLSIEEQLRKIRDELKLLYSDMKMVKSASRKGIRFGGFEDNQVTLGDLVVIEDKTKG
ncbi:hypothetical protein HYT84_00245 [Candidatus Micrarchaeota archaeon]|nr:hypothetical protein [Candidatus Micrarchaeota archaeon]